VPLLELVRIHASQIKRTAVCRRFGDTKTMATTEETKMLKDAGAVPSRAHGIHLVPITDLGAGVVATVTTDINTGAHQHDDDIGNGTHQPEHGSMHANEDAYESMEVTATPVMPWQPSHLYDGYNITEFLELQRPT
jgi:hypothetical protein